MKLSFVPRGSRRLNPTRLIIVGFGTIILLGSILLHFPISARNGQTTDWMICLFTATSATCVTGLAQVDTFLHWSGFGQGVILVMIQLGGLGFVTLMTLFLLALRRRIGMGQRMMIASALNMTKTSGVVRVARHALIGTFCIEGIGAVVLAFRFVPQFGFAQGLWFSVFHSVSAFCNGGFDLMGGYSGPFSSLMEFSDDPLVLWAIMLLIILGGSGFFVWEDVIEHKRWNGLTLYTKMVVLITVGLIVSGWIFFLAAEWNNPETLGMMSTGEKVLNALFQSVTLRTAGFSTIDQGALTEGSAAISAFLMLIGGSSGSTAGGVKTVTAGILMLTLWESLRGREQVVVHGRTIPQRRVLDALTLAMSVMVLLLAGAIALSMLDGLPILTAGYETASALGTVGLSMGVTPQLSTAGSLIMILYMYLGRVGILSFSIAFLIRPAESKLHYPPVDMLIG